MLQVEYRHHSFLHGLIEWKGVHFQIMLFAVTEFSDQIMDKVCKYKTLSKQGWDIRRMFFLKQNTKISVNRP